MVHRQPDGHNPLLTATLPPAIASPQRPSRQTPRRAAIGWRAGPMAGRLLGRVGPGVARGARGAGVEARAREPQPPAGAPRARVRVLSVCPRPVRVSGRVRASPPCGSRHPHGQVRGGPGPVAAGQAAGPKTARFCLGIGAAAAPWRPGMCLGPGGRRQRCVRACCGLQACPGGLQQAGG